jgi:hypothetical protein
MRAIRTCLFAALAACGGGDSKPDALIIIPDAAPDAPPDAFEPMFDFTCMGNAAPTTATANVTLGGIVGEIVLNGTQPQFQASHGAKVDVCKASSTTCTGADQLDTITTPASGCPSMGCPFTTDPLATMSMPLDLYVKATKTGNRSTYVFPHAPVTADVPTVPAVMFSSGLIQLLGLAGITQEAGKANLLLAVTDCATMPITDTGNVQITVKQDGVAVQGTQVVDASMFAPQFAGTFAVFNVPVSSDNQVNSKLTEVGGSWKGKALRAHNVTVFRDSTTATQLRPGY